MKRTQKILYWNVDNDGNVEKETENSCTYQFEWFVCVSNQCYHFPRSRILK